MDKRIFALFMIFLLSLSVAFATLGTGNIKIFAVTDDEVGMIADLALYTIPGTGEVSFITSNSLVGKDTQTTGNIALDIAREKTGNPADQYSFVFDIKANASEVEGPSAGAAMTLLAYSLLSERPLREEIGITGTINNDGSVGVVGGVYPKAKIASEEGIKLFMIPKGEARQVIKEGGSVESVNLLSYGPEKLGMKIVEVSMIDEVIEYAYSDIDSIEVDVTASVNGFVPEAINYKPSLEPMKRMSQAYVDRANGVIEEAKKELESTTLEEDVRSRFYPRIGVTERNSEMASVFLDQNYLYSSANFAFNARILAGTVKEIADNPSLLNKDSKILNNKISTLKREINLTKKELDFITLDNIEWVIGAQQRIAYAENALKTLEETEGDLKELEELSDNELEDILFNRVYDYVSAEAWHDAAKDFLKEAKKSDEKKIPQYSGKFILGVEKKILIVEGIINDSNASEASLLESIRRLNAAKISFDNNFYFAALYDAYFSEAFLSSEEIRKDYDDNFLYSTVENNIYEKKEEFDSVWASLFIDHAIFFFENAKFEQELGRTGAVRSSLDTAFDLLTLAENIDEAKEEVDIYLVSNSFQEYIGRPDLDTSIDISYAQRIDPMQLITVVFVLALIISLGVLMFFGIKGNKSSNRGPVRTRIAKLERVRNNLDSALTKKKISEAEYFFMKKRYDDELKDLRNEQAERSRTITNLDESKAKLNALISGRKALQKHYKAGVVIEEDYRKHYVDLTKEIVSLKGEIQMYESMLGIRRKRKAPFKTEKDEKNDKSEKKQKKKESKTKKTIKRKHKSSKKTARGTKTPSDNVKGTQEASDDIKGTKELAKEEAEKEKKETNKRKAALNKYKEKKSKKK